MTKTTRVTAGVTAVKSRTYGLTGQVWRETWPSGATVDHLWAASGELVNQVLTATGVPTTTATMSYDAQNGAPNGWTYKQGPTDNWWAQVDTVSSTRLEYRTWTQYNPSSVALQSQTYDVEWTAGGRLDRRSSPGTACRTRTTRSGGSRG